jgi:dTDP-4-amino-4,6-dideoxygalactose transaminase
MKIALNGGVPLRKTEMPQRRAFGDEEEEMLKQCISYYKERNLDPGYEGYFESLYCNAFSEFMGGGFADAVNSGTNALYVAIRSLDLPKGGEVLVSPITDPGTISAIILNGLVPKLVDTEKENYNSNSENFISRFTSKTCAILVVHSIGNPAEITDLISFAKDKKVPIIEDCSQSHGALLDAKRVGSFGDVAAFSTMYRKSHITGGTGGVIFTKNQEIYKKVVAHADRGKPRWDVNFNDRDPRDYLFPALNFNSNELSCAIGIASIKRIDVVRANRLNFIQKLYEEIKFNSVVTPMVPNNDSSPFIYPIKYRVQKSKNDKMWFAQALLAEGIPLNVDYKYLVSEWNWVQKYLSDDFTTPNAREVRDQTFCLYLNENYGLQEIIDVRDSIEKISTFLTKTA